MATEDGDAPVAAEAPIEPTPIPTPNPDDTAVAVREEAPVEEAPAIEATAEPEPEPDETEEVKDDQDEPPSSARSVINDDQFAATQILSFVSPQAFGENSRKVAKLTDGLERRLAALEKRTSADKEALIASMDDRITAMLAEKLGPFLAGIQGQVTLIALDTCLYLSHESLHPALLCLTVRFIGVPTLRWTTSAPRPRRGTVSCSRA